MFGIYFKEQLVGVLKIGPKQLSFSYVKDFKQLKLKPLPSFPLIKIYRGASVLNFILSRVQVKALAESKNIEDVIAHASKISHSLITIKRLKDLE